MPVMRVAGTALCSHDGIANGKACVSGEGISRLWLPPVVTCGFKINTVPSRYGQIKAWLQLVGGSRNSEMTQAKQASCTVAHTVRQQILD